MEDEALLMQGDEKFSAVSMRQVATNYCMRQQFREAVSVRVAIGSSTFWYRDDGLGDRMLTVLH